MKKLVVILAAVAALSSCLQAKQGRNHMDLLKNIHWLGHDAFKITAGGKVIYIDPFRLKSAEKADLILVTHAHHDHFSPEDIMQITGPQTLVVSIAEVLKGINGLKQEVKAGDKLEAAGFKIEVVPAYNTNKKYHPKEAGMVGYIITAGGVRIYHAGDTDLIPEMKKMKVDVALLPVSGTYVMTSDEAAGAAKVIKPKVAVPMHYGSIAGSEDDADNFKEKLKGKINAVILQQEK